MKPIHVIILFAIILFVLYYANKTAHVEHMDAMIDPIPEFEAYQPMESPSDMRYVYYPEENIYLLPYEELDMTFPYHRWMYYYYPSFYSSYYAYNWPFNYPADDSNFYYGGSYGGDYGGDFAGYYGDYSINTDPLYRTFPYRTESPNRVIIPPLYQSPKFDTNNYPTSKTGFAGGLYSQRFSNAGSSLRRGSIQGRPRERFDVIKVLDDDSYPNSIKNDDITAKKNNKCDFKAGSHRKINTGTNLLVKSITTRGGNTMFPYKSSSCVQKNEIEKFETINESETPQNDKINFDQLQNKYSYFISQQDNNVLIDSTPRIITSIDAQNISSTSTKLYTPYSLFPSTQLDYPDDEFGYVINDDTVSTIDNKSTSSSNESNLMDRKIATSGLEEPIAVVL